MIEKKKYLLNKNKLKAEIFKVMLTLFFASGSDSLRSASL